MEEDILLKLENVEICREENRVIYTTHASRFVTESSYM